LQLNVNNDYLSRTVMDNINFNEDIPTIADSLIYR
jgi:hypothetical protein